jgi:abortive infection bacteriophage resistance protein
MLKSAGRFFLTTNIPIMFYSKKYASPTDLIALLQTRGLIINDESKAINYIKRIGYYRLSAYFYPLLESPKQLHKFKPNTSFEKALLIYRFDRQLRLFIFNHIEKIEIAIRSAISNIMSRETNDPFWMTNPIYFASTTLFNNSIQKINNEYNTSKEDFIIHFKNTYQDNYPPSWMLAEIIPLGVLTRIYQNIKNNAIRKMIAQEFYLNIPVLESWMTIITVTRNNCCHHSRIWNKTYGLNALLIKRLSRPWIGTTINHRKIYFSLCIIKYFMNTIVPNNDMTIKLSELLQKYPSIDIKAMGFSSNWIDEDLWRYNQ